MNKDEAIKVIEIIKHADGGCEFCVDKLEGLFKTQFPNFAYLLDKRLNKVKNDRTKKL